MRSAGSTTWSSRTATCRRPTACAILLDDGSRVVVRPSGTEPKLKCYLEVVVPVADDVPAARAEARRRLAAIRSDLATALGLG